MRYWILLERSAGIRIGASVIVLLGAVVLPFLMNWAAHWYSEREREMHQLVAMNETIPSLSAARDSVQAWRETEHRWRGITHRAQEQGLLHSQWDRRSFRVDGTTMSRARVDTLLRSLSNNADAFMVPDSFSLRLVNDRQSLFTVSPGQDREDAVHVSLSGTYYSRKAN